MHNALCGELQMIHCNVRYSWQILLEFLTVNYMYSSTNCPGGGGVVQACRALDNQGQRNHVLTGRKIVVMMYSQVRIMMMMMMMIIIRPIKRWFSHKRAF